MRKSDNFLIDSKYNSIKNTKMSNMPYDLRIHANLVFDSSRVYDPPREYSLNRFSRVIWFGRDYEGNCVYRQDPITSEIVRIDFY